MSLMNQFAVEAAATDTVNNPAVTAPDNLDTGRVLSLLGLAVPTDTAVPTETRKDFLDISFDENECEPIVSQRDGFEVHYTRTQVHVQVVNRPFRGGWREFKAVCTIAVFVRNGSVIGQTAVLPLIENQMEADAVLFGTSVRQDEIKFL